MSGSTGIPEIDRVVAEIEAGRPASTTETERWWQAFCATKFTLTIPVTDREADEDGEKMAARIVEAVDMDVIYRARFADAAIAEAKKRGRA